MSGSTGPVKLVAPHALPPSGNTGNTVSIEESVRFALEHPLEAPPTTAHAENVRKARPIMRALTRQPGVVEQLRAARTADEVHEILGAHLTHATPSIRRRWAAAGEARIGELRAGALS